MTIQILDAALDCVAWHSLLDELPDELNDIYFYPEYIQLHQMELGSRAVMFVFRRMDNIWLYPFVLRPIFLKGECDASSEWYDIESQYGYGGPLSTTEDADFLRDANNAFLAWASETGVIAEFIRFHPLLNNNFWVSDDVEVIFDRETISLDCRNYSDEMAVLNSKARNMVRRAVREGVEVLRYPIGECLEEFKGLYRQTMGRLHADQYYYFRDGYFDLLATIANKNAFLLAGIRNGEWISASIFLYGETWMHYHLSATNPNIRIPGAINLLVHSAAKIAAKSGFCGIHLGGGMRNDSDDSLLSFKKSIGDSSHKFFIGKRIHDEDVYSDLKNKWAGEYPELAEKYSNRILCYRLRR